MWLATRIRSRQGGFTLLEILVALAIFSIAAAIAYKGLDAVIASKQAMEREIRFWRETGQVFERMEMDFTQIAPRAWQTTPNSYLPPLQGEVTEREGFYVELSRSDDERAPLRVVYQCEAGELSMRQEPINQQRRPSERPAIRPPAHVLLRQIERCELAYLSAEQQWVTVWPGQQARLKPAAIRVRLTLAGRGNFERIFYLP